MSTVTVSDCSNPSQHPVPKTATASCAAISLASGGWLISTWPMPYASRAMIALDSSILARFYVEDPSDPGAAKQRPIAGRILTESPSLFVPITVILELEWVSQMDRRTNLTKVELVMG